MSKISFLSTLANTTRWQIFGSYSIVALVISTAFVAVQTVVYIVYLACFVGFANYASTVALTGTFSALGMGREP